MQIESQGEKRTRKKEKNKQGPYGKEKEPGIHGLKKKKLSSIHRH